MVHLNRAHLLQELSVSLCGLLDEIPNSPPFLAGHHHTRLPKCHRHLHCGTIHFIQNAGPVRRLKEILLDCRRTPKQRDDTREVLEKGRQGQQIWEVVNVDQKFAPQQDSQTFTVCQWWSTVKKKYVVFSSSLVVNNATAILPYRAFCVLPHSTSPSSIPLSAGCFN